MSSTPPGGPAWEHALPEAAREALEVVLEPEESVELVAPAVGSSLVLTQRRLILVRDGASFRPKTGIRSFVLEPGFSIRIGPAPRRVIIDSVSGTVNVFIRPERLAQAEAFVAEVRRRIHTFE
jgi:hypothetical protein